MSRKTRPFAVYCLWEFDEASDRKRWKFVEAYGVDQDGYSCTPSKHASGDRCSYIEWMNQKIWYNEDTKEWSETKVGDHSDWRPIPGRVATLWTTEGGSRLAAFNPPTNTPWISDQFISELCKMRNWHVMLEDGYTLYMGTAREVEKLMF